MDKVITLVTVRPPRLNSVVGVAVSMGANVLFVERVVGLQKSSFGHLPEPYDRVWMETSRRAHKETLDAIIGAARSGCLDDGKAFIFNVETRDESIEGG